MKTGLVDSLTQWYRENARELPWRGTAAAPWRVLVSEIMLQQTPVVRVLPVFDSWMLRWPAPADLAASSTGDAVVMWGRLGYPRRALRLHAAAVACVERHAGEVPSGVGELRALPGVGEYTAAAVAAFAFGQRVAVLDTNVRRVQARVLDGVAFASTSAPTLAERRRALHLLPADEKQAAETSAAFMELGALVCRARAPACSTCPVAPRCQWLLGGRPEWTGPPRRGQTYAGTDRQCRGRLLAVVRDSAAPVPEQRLIDAWPDAAQRERALSSLLHDGLIERVTPRSSNGKPRFRLPR